MYLCAFEVRLRREGILTLFAVGNTLMCLSRKKFVMENVLGFRIERNENAGAGTLGDMLDVARKRILDSFLSDRQADVQCLLPRELFLGIADST